LTSAGSKSVDVALEERVFELSDARLQQLGRGLARALERSFELLDPVGQLLDPPA
jgi:hypothetical protein